MYAACSRRLATPTSMRRTDVDEVRRVESTTHRHPAHPRPRLPGVGEDPPVAGVARGIERGEADVAVVGHVEREPAPGLGVVHRHDEVGTHAPDHRGQVASQREPVLDHAVDVILEELHRLDPDDRGAGPLLGLAQRARLGGIHAVDARFPAGDEEVRDALAVGGPARDRRGRAVLEVVGVRDDAERALPVVGEGQQVAHAGSSRETPSNDT